MSNRPPRRRVARADRPATSFDPVPVRARHDGWTPERQAEFIETLAESGCVDEACKRVGMATSSAYALRRRVDAQGFRHAWDIALDYAVRRLSDAAFSRALHGVARPVFYKGEQIGEVRRYDERLTQFILRYRDPVRYGAWLDDIEFRRHPDGAAITLAKAVDQVEADAWAAEEGEPRPRGPALVTHVHLDREEVEARERAERERVREAAERARLDAEFKQWSTGGEGDSEEDVA